MLGVVEAPVASPGTSGFSVSHQKVELYVDFSMKRIKGRTEITINPHSKDFKTFRLNCRQCALTRININGKGPTLKYSDPYQRFKVYESATVYQHHQIQRHLEPMLKLSPDEELVVNLPKAVKIEENHTLPSSEELGSRCTPITVNIEFIVDVCRDGIQFVGCDEGDTRYPHAYTKNLLYPGSACCLFPCVDSLTSRCTWEIAIRCPRTVRDALRHGEFTGEADQQENRRTVAEDEDDELEMTVVCSGDLTDDIVDPLDPTQRTVSFACSTPVTARHIGFAIGPFENVNLTAFRETDEDDKLGSNAIRVHGFCLPGRGEEVKNTCMPMAKAIDYFVVTYGSFPFSSYKMCFVDDLVVDTIETAGLSLCSNRMLFPPDIIEPLDRVTRKLVYSLASQYIGVDIIAAEPTDLWAIVGVAYFITDMFIKQLCGNNEYRFWQKRMVDRICEVDMARPSIYAMGALLDLDVAELDFIALKAPVVLFILDRRLAKASGSSGLSRIISRIFLNAKVAELPNGALTTAHFMRTCEKLGHTKLDVFFDQWVYGAGCPRFSVTQRFNKKKLVVEMLIRQTQTDRSPVPDLEKDTFMRDVREEINDVDAGEVQRVFTGPMTIRIHEADGTPYEHIVEIKEHTTRFEIPYSTKYKRLKRSRRQKERAAAASGSGMDAAAEVQDDVLLYCLGDVLQTEDEVRQWQLADWAREDEERMSQESYEWIRMDADFEWISQMTFSMPGYMYLSQLQQDRDVVAQYQSVQFIASQRETPLVSTILVRTLMDRRYFHGIRTAAAQALARTATEELNWVGLLHLEKAFQEFFCFSNSPMTRSNDFSDRTAYYIQCIIPQAISRVRDRHGKVLFRAKRFLFEKLKFNDNTNNEFSDNHYIASLMTALSRSLIPTGNNMYGIDEDEDRSERKFREEAIEEIERYRRMDEWIGSYQNVYSTTALQCKRRLAQSGIIPTNLVDFFQYTRVGTFDMLRLEAFGTLMDMGTLKDDTVLEYFLHVLSSDPSPFVRTQMLRLFGNGLAAVALGDDDDRNATEAEQAQDALIIEGEGAAADARQAGMRRTQSVPGALEALKAQLADNETLKKALWDAAISRNIGVYEMRDLLDICSVLYEPVTSLKISLRYPRYYSVRHLGHGKLQFRWSPKVRHTMKPAPWVPPRKSPPRQIRTEPAPQPRGPTKLIFTTKKKQASVGNSSSLAAAAQSPGSLSPGGQAHRSTAAPAAAKPKLTLKLKLPGSRGG